MNTKRGSSASKTGRFVSPSSTVRKNPIHPKQTRSAGRLGDKTLAEHPPATSGGGPKMKNFLPTAAPAIDYVTECDLAFSAYLQALVKRDLVEKSIAKQRQSCTDQLTIARDTLNQRYIALAKIQQDIEQLNVCETLQLLEEEIAAITKAASNVDFGGQLEAVSRLLEQLSNHIQLINVDFDGTEDNWSRLGELLAKLLHAMDALHNSGRLSDALDDFVDLMRMTARLKDDVSAMVAKVQRCQKSATLDLMRQFSDAIALNREEEL